jgi:hypothetical protein
MQDFTQRFAIVIREDLPSWQALNAVAHIAAYLGNKMRAEFDTGEHFETQDGAKHPRNSQYPIVVLKAAAKDLPGFVQAVRQSGLPYLGFIREMVETTDDAEIVNILKDKADSEIEYLGVGVFGPNEAVKPLTKKFSLWK